MLNLAKSAYGESMLFDYLLDCRLLVVKGYMFIKIPILARSVSTNKNRLVTHAWAISDRFCVVDYLSAKILYPRTLHAQRVKKAILEPPKLR